MEEEETLEERQNNEMEVLESIFMEDFYDLRKADAWKIARPPEIKLKLSPQQSMHGDLDVHVAVTLYVKCSDDYPNSLPAFRIEDEKGLSKQHVIDLQEELMALAMQHLGEVMILDMAQHVKNYLHAHNKPAYKSCYEEMISNQKKQQEQHAEENERKRYIMKQEQEKQSQAIQEEIIRKQEAMRKESRRRRSLSVNNVEKLEEKTKEDNVNTTKPILKQKSSEEENRDICTHHQGSVVIKFNCKPEKSIRRSHCIGHGDNGDVNYAGIDIITGEMFIITQWTILSNSVSKKLNPQDNDVKECFKQLTLIEQEMSSVSKLNHPGLTRYVAMRFSLEKNKVIAHVLKEFIYGGCLSYYITNKIKMEMPMLQNITKDILSTLHYLHDSSVVHRDLSDTCLYVDESGLIKLSNYSIHRRLVELVANFCNQKIIERFPLSLGRGGKKADVYRLGMVLLSLAQGELIDAMIPEIPPTLPSIFSTFLTKCLMKDEKERWSVIQLVNHTFIKPTIENLCDPCKKEKFEDDNVSAENPVSVVGISSDAFNQSRIKDEFQILKWLGKGGFGDVLKVRNKLDGGVYALKRILLNPSNRLLNKKITREVKLLSRLNHENVVRYYNSWIETSIEDVIDEDDNNSTSASAQSSNVTSKSKVTSSIVSFGIKGDDIEKMAPKGAETSLDWTMSSHHHDIVDDDDDDDDSSSDEEDVFGISCLIPSESSDSIAFENSKCDHENKSEATDSESLDTVDSNKKSSDDISNMVKKQKITHCMYIQMEFCENSTLRSAIDDGLYKEKDRMWRLFREIIEGLVHIHQQGMIHRDLKPVNIFLDSSDHVKIGDFGLATTDIRVKPSLLDNAPLMINPDPLDISQLDQLTTADGSMTGHVGTALYVAPELAATGTKPIYSQKVDIYSLGIMFFEMCYPVLATGMERVKVLANIRMKELKMPADVDKQLSEVEINVVQWLLDHDQNLRPTSQELLSSDLLPPAQIEQTLLNEHFKKTISNPQSKAYKYLVSNLFKQKTSVAADFTYDCNLSSIKQSTCVGSALVFRHVSDTLVKIFQKHGAIQMTTPLLMPQTERYSSDEWNVNLMDHGGGIISLPRDLRMGFARAVARRDVTNIKRYVIDRVYRERRVFGGHPRELYECSFDIVTSCSANLLPDAEVLVVVNEIINEFPQLQKRNYFLRLSHTSMLKSILLYCGIPDEKLADIHLILKQVASKDVVDKVSLHTKLVNMDVTEHSITLLLSFVHLEDSFSKVSNAVKLIVKKRGQVGSLIKQSLHELECIINHTRALGFNLPIVINPLCAYSVHHFHGMFFQFVCELKKKRKPTLDVLAVGGRYDPLITSFRLNTSIPGTAVKESGQHGVGISIAVDKITNALTEDHTIDDSLVDVFVCSVGHKSMLKEKCALVKDLWHSGIKAHIQYDSSQDLDEVYTTCKELGITYMVILKDPDTSIVKLRTLDKDRFTEKKLNVVDLPEYIIKSLTNKSDNSDNTSSTGFIKYEFNKVTSNSDATSLTTSSNVSITYLVSEKLKINLLTRRRYETQITTSLSSSLLQIVSNKTVVQVIVTDVNAAVLKTIVSCLEIYGDQQAFDESITSIIEKHQRHRKCLTRLCDQIYQLRFEKRCAIVVLYSIIDNVHKVII